MTTPAGTGAAPGGGRTLLGRVVLVTRPRPQSEELEGLLDARGAVPLVAPAIELESAPGEALDRVLGELGAGRFAWLILTSRAGVEAVASRLRGRADTAIRARVAAVGDGTARALREAGVEPDLVPDTFTTEALGRAFPEGAGRVLLARADIAPSELEAAVADKGWTPVRVDAYRTRPAREVPEAAAAALRAGRVDAVTFTSASTVDAFIRLAGAMLDAAPRRPAVVCIGPVTARAAETAGLVVDAEADPHTIEGLVAALERLLGPAPGDEESP